MVSNTINKKLNHGLEFWIPLRCKADEILQNAHVAVGGVIVIRSRRVKLEGLPIIP